LFCICHCCSLLYIAGSRSVEDEVLSLNSGPRIWWMHEQFPEVLLFPAKFSLDYLEVEK
jgi:hypothetical protein